MFERFTDKGRKIIILAREEAERHQNDYLGTEHIVLGVLREGDGIALAVLKRWASPLSRSGLRLKETFRAVETPLHLAKFPSHLV